MYRRTPRSTIKGMLRQMFLKSKERSECLKRDNYTCQRCNKKQTMKKGQVFKVEVHHINGIRMWDDVINMIQEQLLCYPTDLLTLCRACHDKE